MSEQQTVAQKPSQTARVRPSLSLNWSLDPTTGKPVARWNMEQAERRENLALRPAA